MILHLSLQSFYCKTLPVYNHGQRSRDKFTFAALFHTRQTNSSTLVQPLPPTMLDTCTAYFTRSFNVVLGGGGGGGGREATHFKTDNSAFFKTPFQKHRKLMQLHKCPKEFCPPLSDFHVS